MITFKRFILEQDNKQKAVFRAASMLGVSVGDIMHVSSIDDNILDKAREQVDTRATIPSAAGNWVVRLFKTVKDTFVQVMPPKDAEDTKPMYYFKKETP